MKVVNCDKCLKDEDETVPATHNCKQCKMNYCDNHLNLHNTSNKTKSHVNDLVELSAASTIRNCDKCLKDEDETVPATHSCPSCNMCFCENHLNLHNTSNKTKSHASSVVPIESQVSAAKNCDKCLTDDEEKVLATHHCKQCNAHMCENHLKLHNSSNKTKSHVNDVSELTSAGSSSGGSSVAASSGGFVPFSGNYNHIGTLGENEDFNFEFAGVAGLAIDPVNRTIFVADRWTFFEFDLKTKMLKNHFKEPQDRDNMHLCYDTKDKALVYVIDRCCASTIVKISRNGKMVFWENDGTGMIYSMAVDKVDGTIYIAQNGGVDFLSPDTGKIIKTLRQNIQGNNVFGLSRIDCMGINVNNELVLINEDTILVTNKNGKILKKFDKQRTYTQKCPQFEPNTNKIYCVQYGIDSMNEDGTCLTSFMNENSPYKFGLYHAGSGMVIALDSATGELYCGFAEKNVVLVFK